MVVIKLFLALVRGVNEIRILIRYSKFKVQKELLNEYRLAEKLHKKILTSYRRSKGYFQEERFQKLDIGFISLSLLASREPNHSNWLNTA